jgi:plastocyanin
VIRARRTSAALAGIAVAVAPALAGCSNTTSAATRETYSGSASATVVGGVQQVTLTVGPSFRFAPSTITVHPGQVKVTLHHTGAGAPHDWQLSIVPGAYIPEIGDNQTRSVSFTAPAPGKYQFVCTIHLRQGQTGTLIVLPR